MVVFLLALYQKPLPTFSIFSSKVSGLFCVTSLLLLLSGSEAAAVGLHPGQCILKVNGSNASHGNYLDVLEHFTAYRTKQQEVLV